MKPKQIKVVLIERHLIFYREELYRRLAGLYDMTFLHSGEQLGDLPELTGVRKKVVRSLAFKVRGRGKVVWMSVPREIFAIRPEVVISEISASLMSTWALFLLRPLLKFRLLFWGHGLEDYWKTRPRVSPGDRLRLLWFKWSDGVIVYGNRGLNDLRAFLPEHPNLVRSPNTLNSDAQAGQFTKLELEGRPAVRRELAISSFAFVYIGRLADDRGLERIPALVRYLRARGVSFEIHFIGSGPARGNLQNELDGLGVRVVFHGTLTEESSKGRVLYGCDCLLGPGPLGLAIVDAMGYGCPVLALHESNFNRKHSPEIEYVKQGVSGYLEPTMREWMSRALELATSSRTAMELRHGALATFRAECRICFQLDTARGAIDRCVTRIHPQVKKS